MNPLIDAAQGRHILGHYAATDLDKNTNRFDDSPAELRSDVYCCVIPEAQKGAFR